jgi:hypothetical protein
MIPVYIHHDSLLTCNHAPVHSIKKSLKIIRIRISKKNRQHSGQKDKQRSTKHTHKTKYRVTLTSRQTVVTSLRTLEDTKEVAYVVMSKMIYDC